jgi:flavin reductase
MRQLASGVTLVTGGTLEKACGLIATAVASVSLEPPTLLACVSHDAFAFGVIEESGVLAINLLGLQHKALIDQFSDAARRDERFTKGAWTTLSTGAPVLEDALAVFDCRVVQRMRYTTHTIFLAIPEAVRIAGGEPIVHFDRGFFELDR